MTTIDYDIVVVGGGMVGAVVAGLLSEEFNARSLNLALLEAVEPQNFIAGDDVDLRVSAISRSSQCILQAAGAWEEIAQTRISPYCEMRVWDARQTWNEGGALHFDSSEIGEANLGHIVENRLIQHALLRRLHAASNVDLLMPVRVTGLTAEADIMRLDIDGKESITTRLLVAADGANSQCREIMGIATSGWAYDQRAVVTHVECERPHGKAAYQRFLPTGPLALLPLADGRCSVVWSTTRDDAQSLLAGDADQFQLSLSRASDYVLGELAASAPRASFPLQLMHANVYTRPRFALVGDAAHSVHPLAGQGANMGFLDAAALCQVLLEGLDEGVEPGDALLLRRYERWRKGENLATMAALEGFKRFFGESYFAPLVIPALSLMNRLGPVKNMLIRRAMGLDGDLPALATFSGIRASNQGGDHAS